MKYFNQHCIGRIDDNGKIREIIERSLEGHSYNSRDRLKDILISDARKFSRVIREIIGKMMEAY